MPCKAPEGSLRWQLPNSASRIGTPEVILQQRAELGGDEPHLGGQLGLLLAEVRCVRLEAAAHHDECLRSDRTVLGAAEAQHVHALGQFRERAAEEGGCVGEAGPVQEQPQGVGVAEVRDLPDLGQRVAGAELG